jgi:tetratricopeptide (TPR) repeat protein
MSLHGHQRRVLLFVIAIIIPSIALIALSLRMMNQERELAEKRLAEEQRRVASVIRQELLARLERIKLRETSALASPAEKAWPARAENPAVVLIGRVEKNRLTLPWEMNRAADEFQQLLSEGELARKIQRGEQEELVSKQFGRAARLYRQAASAARHPAQTAYAQLLLARALAKAGRQGEANALYSKILSLPVEISDEQGIPFSLYAAGQLLAAGIEYQPVIDRIRAEADAPRWRSPGEAYTLRDLADRLIEVAPDAALRKTAQEIQRKILNEIRRIEQALALQNDFPNLRPTQAAARPSQNPEPAWFPYGEETWLVSLAPLLGSAGSVVVAVRAQDVFIALDAATSRRSSRGRRLITSRRLHWPRSRAMRRERWNIRSRNKVLSCGSR